MIISLIGMSGSGKSYWSKQLEKVGFKRICCDDLIEEKLSEELKKLGYSGIADVSKWMGQPYEPQFKKTSSQYLAYENLVMEEIYSFLEENKKIVVDTTGSVIYTNAKTLENLKKLTKIIYLKVPESVEKEMFNLYITDPKPVVWGNSFNKKSAETNLNALKRCYPDLLSYRSKQYEKLAKVTMDYHKLRNKNFGISHFLEEIK